LSLIWFLLWGAPPHADGEPSPGDQVGSPSAFRTPASPVADPVRIAARIRTFQTPSKRIVCRYSSSGGPGPYLRCDVLSLNDVGFILDRLHRARRISVTDTAADTTKASILDYGKSRRFGTFRCRSQRSGLTCRSLKSDHGFKLSREKQRVF
jgi:hypothetical protein